MIREITNYCNSTSENRISFTFPFIFLISPLPLHRFMSNLVSTESPYQGEFNDVGHETRGRVSIEDIGDYRNGTLRIKFKILLHSKLGPLSPGYFPSLDQCPPSILRRFGRFRICFWGRKVSFTSRISRV